MKSPDIKSQHILMFRQREKSGLHLICDIKNIQIEYTFSEIMQLMEYVCEEHQYEILHKSYYKFDDKQAFTILFLLGESHFSVHTYPEKQTIALDLYTCREYEDYNEYYHILDLLKTYFRCKIVYRIIEREF
jgi:S-adenosylmethionine/arginine decarboxylase-like enzyme